MPTGRALVTLFPHLLSVITVKHACVSACVCVYMNVHVVCVYVCVRVYVCMCVLWSSMCSPCLATCTSWMLLPFSQLRCVVKLLLVFLLRLSNSCSQLIDSIYRQIFVYKLVRFYHATLFLVTQLVSSGTVHDNTAAINAAIAFFSVTMVSAVLLTVTSA